MANINYTVDSALSNTDLTDLSSGLDSFLTIVDKVSKPVIGVSNKTANRTMVKVVESDGITFNIKAKISKVKNGNYNINLVLSDPNMAVMEWVAEYTKYDAFKSDLDSIDINNIK